MPLLSTNYLSVFQFLYNKKTRKNILLKSFTCNQNQEVKPISLLQGSIGSHIKDVGAIWWEATMDAPIFVFSEGRIESPMDIISNSIFSDPIFVYDDINMTALLNKATISIEETGASCSLTLIGDNDFMENLFTAQSEAKLYDRIGRTVRNYDCSIKVDDFFTAGILSGSIEISPTINKNYFLNSSFQAETYFSANDYRITGKLKIIYDIKSNSEFNSQNSENFFFTSNATGLNFIIGSYNVNFPGVEIMYSLFNKTVSAPGITTAEISFETFAPAEIRG